MYNLAYLQQKLLELGYESMTEYLNIEGAYPDKMAKTFGINRKTAVKLIALHKREETDEMD